MKKLMTLLKASWPILTIFLVIVIFFRAVLFSNLLPIPADTIVALYHPFRDLYAEQYPVGIPFKNFLITDPVRQLLPWKDLAIDMLKKGEIPLWNSYNMAGIPLLANFQTAAFYPFNILFFLLPFLVAWSFLIIAQPLLAGILMYFYLRSLNLEKLAGLLGAIAFAFSGFFVAWMEWGTILHAALWLPLILLSIDKIFLNLGKKYTVWFFVFLFSLISSFFAGHLQTFFYVFVISLVYLIVRWWQYGKDKTTLGLFAVCYLLFMVITAIQWLPTLQLIEESARSIDQVDWQRDGWFIPWQHLAQFVAPDFFGNPTTLNYLGVWNYGEFIGYIGILPLILALFAIITRRDKKTMFFGLFLFVVLLLALPTPIAKVPYILNIPFLSTAQPTRLIFLADFLLAILAALGFDYFMRRKKQIFYPVIIVGLILAVLWLFAFKDDISVAKNNLILPTSLFAISIVIFLVLSRLKKGVFTLIIYIIMAGVVTFDLIRFGWKFLPFTNREYLFPQTEVLNFLQKQQGIFRIMTTDDRILPPNFSVMYRLQSVDGYDPLYLKRYGELIAASERGEPNISSPFGFNRIITPKNYESKIIDLLGVKYVLSLADLQSPKLVKVFQEGETRVYENEKILPRAFFVEEIHSVASKNEAIRKLFEQNFNPRKTAVVENYRGVLSSTPWKCIKCEAEIATYSESMVIIETKNGSEGFLVLTDSFYPTWQATIDGAATEIYRTDYNFRGVVVPKGRHTVIFYSTLL